jgi:hypothetical protein
MVGGMQWFVPSCLPARLTHRLQVYMVEPPDLELSFTGAAALAAKGFPAIGELIDAAVEKACRQLLVLPNRVYFPLTTLEQTERLFPNCLGMLPREGAEPSTRPNLKKHGTFPGQALLAAPPPLGVLSVRPVRATDLYAVDSRIFGTDSSDPYVVVGLADQEWHSVAVKRSTEPVWAGDIDGDDWTAGAAQLLVYNPLQQLHLAVWDKATGGLEDLGKRDAPIGIATDRLMMQLICHRLGSPNVYDAQARRATLQIPLNRPNKGRGSARQSDGRSPCWRGDEQQRAKMFHQLDTDASGSLDREEMQTMLRLLTGNDGGAAPNLMSDPRLKALLDACPPDGSISFEDFDAAVADGGALTVEILWRPIKPIGGPRSTSCCLRPDTPCMVALSIVWTVLSPRWHAGLAQGVLPKLDTYMAPADDSAEEDEEEELVDARMWSSAHLVDPVFEKALPFYLSTVDPGTNEPDGPQQVVTQLLIDYDPDRQLCFRLVVSRSTGAAAKPSAGDPSSPTTNSSSPATPPRRKPGLQRQQSSASLAQIPTLHSDQSPTGRRREDATPQKHKNNRSKRCVLRSRLCMDGVDHA